MSKVTPKMKHVADRIGVEWMRYRLKSIQVGVEKNHTIVGVTDFEFANGLRVSGFALRRNPSGSLLLDPPSKIHREPCHACGKSHELSDSYCPYCGVEADPERRQGKVRRKVLAEMHRYDDQELLRLMAVEAFIAALIDKVEVSTYTFER